MERICVSCPKGCRLTIEKNGEQIEVTGNLCPRGKAYGISEVTNPVRTLTTTIYLPEQKRMLPVRSDKPVAKNRMQEYLLKIKKIPVHLPVQAGTVLLYDIDGTGVNIISTDTITK